MTKAEFRAVYKKEFPTALFEPVWRAIDKDGDGSLSMCELADHFGMSHLVREAKAEVETDPLSDMASIEEKLSYMTEATSLSSEAGGIIGKFFMYDVWSFAIISLLVGYHMQDIGYDVTQWKVHARPSLLTTPCASLHTTPWCRVAGKDELIFCQGHARPGLLPLSRLSGAETLPPYHPVRHPSSPLRLTPRGRCPC